MAEPPANRSSLTVLGGPLDGTRLVLDDLVDEILIGSDPDCRFALDLPGVSPIHARVWSDLKGVEVRDTRSPRGIYVNDDRVTDRAELRDGDILWLGPPGDEASVMIHCHITTLPAEPAFAASVEEVLVEDVTAESVAFLEAPPSVAADAQDPGSPDPAASSADAEFFVQDEPPARVGGGSAAAPAADEFIVDFPPPASAEHSPAGDEFFVGEETSPTSVEGPGAAASPEDMFYVEETSPPLLTNDQLFEDYAAPSAQATVPAPAEAAPRPIVTPAPAADSTGFPGEQPTPQKPSAPAPIEFVVPGPGPQVDSASAPATAKPGVSAAASPGVADGTRRAATGTGASPRPARREGAAVVPRAGGARRPASSSRTPLYVGLSVVALAALGGLGYVVMRSLGAPQLATVSPARVHVGQVVTLAGKNFATDPRRNDVLFGEKPATVQRATASELQVEVPEVATSPGRDSRLPVRVRVSGRETTSSEIAVYQTPRIHGISPSVALPGEELRLAGMGWGPGARVAFGTTTAEVLEVTDDSIRVRVPEVEGGIGTSAAVVVTMGTDVSNPAPFLLGRLPLITSVEPRTAAAGDVVSVSGKGFEAAAGDNLVMIGTVHALLVVATDSELKVVVPRVALAGGTVPVEVRVRGKEHPGQSTMTVAPFADPLDFRFIPEPFDDAPERQHALLSTGLGPAMVVAASGAKTAAQRALDFASRLNAAAVPLKASRDLSLEVHGLNDDPVIGLMGRPDALIEVSAEDAAAYNEDWTRQGARGGAVTRGRLARWWTAVLKDLVLILVRSEKPQFAAALSAPEARVLGDVFQAARRTSQFGVPRQVADQAKNPYRDGLRLLALRVPASVAGPGGESPEAGAAGVLKLEGYWNGVENEGDRRKYVTITFKGNGGTLAYEGSVSISVNLDKVEQPQKGSVRYSLQAGSSTRHYLGKWDGRKIVGKISSDLSDKGDIGTFELTPR